jgi:DnaJ-class molecular chaperone
MGKPQIMETREDGRTFGWLGMECPRCKGAGQVYLDWKDADGSCPECAGTGEAYGEIKPEPAIEQ